MSVRAELTLVVWHLVASFVDSSEAEIAVFSDLAVLLSAPDERSIALLGEFLRVLVLQGKTDSLSTEPIADVVYFFKSAYNQRLSETNTSCAVVLSQACVTLWKLTGVSIVEIDTHARIDDFLKVRQEIGIDEVACRLELPVDVGI